MSQEGPDKSKFSFGSTVQRRKRDRHAAHEKEKGNRAEEATAADEPEVSPAQDMDALAEAAESTPSAREEDEAPVEEAEEEQEGGGEGEEGGDAEKPAEPSEEGTDEPMAEEAEEAEESNPSAPSGVGADTGGEEEEEEGTTPGGPSKAKNPKKKGTGAKSRDRVTSTIRSINREMNKKTQGKKTGKKKAANADPARTRGDEKEPGSMKDKKRAQLKFKRLLYQEIHDNVPMSVRGGLHLLDLHVA